MIILVFCKPKIVMEKIVTFEICKNCAPPNGCMSNCSIQQWLTINKDIAKQRIETPDRLQGENE